MGYNPRASYAMRDTEIGIAGDGGVSDFLPPPRQAGKASPIILRTPYAMSGTCLEYHATQSLRNARDAGACGGGYNKLNGKWHVRVRDPQALYGQSGTRYHPTVA
eukprot:466798-Rhodomonas_salina.1